MSGYGIAGHRNSFATGVRVGNWVEDRFGAELAQSRREAPATYGTEARQAYARPAVEAEAAAAAAAAEAAAMLTREGLPRHVLFGHGLHYLDPAAKGEDPYVTVNAAMMAPPAERTRSDELLTKGPRSHAVRRAAALAKAAGDDHDAHVRAARRARP